ncbi:hypothetical protein G5V58_06495 [Nocardioides anomalus]|uniref:Uncharacterized protein n=1 Tax=Nocardioides anomalus TaxID=2712223 RepID=A0A6G6WB76_9ACTN|nr:FliH/SctL family protein [Nocardioides anomalus]QIG42466.1 hypothetical protein G5V58_06495 [Nocardioides anomalus]
MTSSNEFRPLPTPELRTGDLTRFGGSTVLGDEVTEHALSSLVEQARTAARSQGYSVGWAEGRRDAAAAAAREAEEREAAARAAREHDESRHKDVLQALTRATEGVVQAVTEAQSAVHAQAVELARELTEAMVGHELRASDAAGQTAAEVVMRVLGEAPTGQPFVLRVHPLVADTSALAELAEAGVRIVPDALLAAHDAIVEVDHRLLDLRISAAIERVREVLT